MKIEFRSSFAKDLKNIRDRNLLRRVSEKIEEVERAKSLSEISQLKKLRGHAAYYRIRIGDYRVGMTIAEDTITFVRLLNRKDIYKHFP